jgi:hypothetical protein
LRDARQEAEEVVAWVQETLPEVVGAYSFGTADKPQAMPDVQVELLQRRLAIEDPLFPFEVLQQVWLHIMQFGISIMVDNTDPSSADDLLKDFSDRLLAAAMNDGTLGQRVEFISPFMTFDFTPPFVEYASDGTKGREMTMLISTGERLGEPQ